MITTVCAALVAVLPLAPSFNSDEQAYLRELRNDQIPVFDDPATVEVGHVCNLLAGGGTRAQAMNALQIWTRTRGAQSWVLP